MDSSLLVSSGVMNEKCAERPPAWCEIWLKNRLFPSTGSKAATNLDESGAKEESRLPNVMGFPCVRKTALFRLINRLRFPNIEGRSYQANGRMFILPAP